MANKYWVFRRTRGPGSCKRRRILFFLLFYSFFFLFLLRGRLRIRRMHRRLHDVQRFMAIQFNDSNLDTSGTGGIVSDAESLFDDGRISRQSNFIRRMVEIVAESDSSNGHVLQRITRLRSGDEFLDSNRQRRNGAAFGRSFGDDRRRSYDCFRRFARYGQQ